MYAQLNDNNEFVDGEPVKIWYRSESFQYTVDFRIYTAPNDWFTSWDSEQKAVAHMFPISSNSWDQERYHQSGPPTYEFDGVIVNQIYPTAPNEEPDSLNRYKEFRYPRIDGLSDQKVAEAEETPTAGEDYTDQPEKAKQAAKKRNNKAKRKNNQLSDAEDHLLDHIDQIYDAADRIKDAIEAAADYDAVDAIMLDVENSTEWPVWVPQ